MYAMFIFSSFAIPSLLFIGAMLYDWRFYDASGISFILIGALSVYSVLPIAGIFSILLGISILIWNYKTEHSKDPYIHFDIKAYFKK